MTIAAVSRKKKDEIGRFADFIKAGGGELLQPTNEWELIRFRGDKGISIIYTNKIGSRTYTGQAQAAWLAFKDGRMMRFTPAPKVDRVRRERRRVLVRTLIERDGNNCFYCDCEFAAEKWPTREHLVPLTSGGPDHLSNQFLACNDCNQEAGHLSAPEKIRLRERKRGWL